MGNYLAYYDEKERVNSTGFYRIFTGLSGHFSKGI
jgi:hypothetical protein